MGRRVLEEIYSPHLLRTMKTFWQSSTATGLLSVLVSMLTVPAIAQPARAAEIPSGSPNVTLPVHRERGNCPSEIQLWTTFRYYEGGGEHTVVMDMSPIASAPAKFMDVRDRVVIYGAPLESQYADCVGWVVAPSEPQYNIWLQFGNAYFRFDLDTLPGRPMAEITYQNIVEGQPYLRWAIVD
jgi:hypothetical protein